MKIIKNIIKKIKLKLCIMPHLTAEEKITKLHDANFLENAKEKIENQNHQ